MDKITIAIDGFSSTGKSTIAKQVAKELGYAYVDSGAMYRAVTLFAISKRYISENHFDVKGLISELPNIDLRFEFNDELGYGEIFLNDKNVENKIRTMKVSSFVSQVATIPEVRAHLVKLQKQIGKNQGVVMDGRDIGTVVFPKAELKIFMVSSPDTRAKRRYDELLDRGEDVNYEEVLKNVQDRDHMDSTRKDSP
ncbi:MAG: (d)CMP kinase, partial [Flavobacteriaceae bacterium]|nr:(d)CMP kinase [Bacteroidia bacterium]NNL61655.1 (d)CMP kinase [Flavobacteriaceae bacterium]